MQQKRLAASQPVDGTGESRSRLVAATLVLLATIWSIFGLSWDIQWHIDVGPDTFFTAPHGMIYSGMTIAGLISLFMVIRTTRRFRQGDPAVTDATTTPWLGRLRAPLGFIVSGMGALCFVLGGAFDLWWHTIYGFDVTLLSPSHFALLFSGFLVLLGTIYNFASELNRARQRQGDDRLSWVELAFIVTASITTVMLSVFLVIGTQHNRLVGPFLVYPLTAAIIYPLTLMLTVSTVRRPWVATLTSVLFTGWRALMLGLTPGWVQWLAHSLSLPYRSGAVRIPAYGSALPTYLIAVGVLVDLGLLVASKARLNRNLSVVLTAALAGVVNFLVDPRWLIWVDTAARPFVRADLEAMLRQAWLPTLPLVAVVAALFGLIGWNAGRVLRHTDR